MKQPSFLSHAVKAPPCEGCDKAALCRELDLACYRFAAYCGSAGPGIVQMKREPWLALHSIHRALFEDNDDETEVRQADDAEPSGTQGEHEFPVAAWPALLDATRLRDQPQDQANA